MSNLTPKQEKRLKRISRLLDSGNVAILEHIFELEEQIDEKLQALEEKMPDLSKVLASVKGNDGEKGERGDKGEPGQDGKDGRDGKDGKDGQPGRDGKDGLPGRDGRDGKDGIDGADGHIKDLAPQEVRDLLELLPEGEKLAIGAIEKLEERLDKLEKRPVSVNGGIIGRNLVQNYDLSPYLDGVTKTFNLPGTWSIVSVACSSFPSILRPSIDYTNTQQSITFTSQIDATTTLATGQTVIITLISA